MSYSSYEKCAVSYQCAKCGNYFGLNCFGLRNRLIISLNDSVLPYFASLKTGNDLVTEKQ